MLEYQLVNLGSMPNAGDGDSVKTAFTKINDNFLAIVDVINTFGNLPTIYTVNLVNTGTLPNDNTGDTLITAFNKINNNFASLFSTINSYAVAPINIEFVSINNNGLSDTLYTAFTKVNNNFTEYINVLLSYFSSQLTVISEPEPQTYEVEPMVFSSPVIVPFTVSTPATQEIINIGALPNDGTGDPLRTAFAKINNNFTTLWNTSTGVGTANTSGSSPGQVIFESAIANYSSASFVVRSKDTGSNSQNITLSAQISNDNSNVSFTAYGTTFIGTPLCRFDMDIDGSNLRILCDPLTANNLSHTIFSQLLVET